MRKEMLSMKSKTVAAIISFTIVVCLLLSGASAVAEDEGFSLRGGVKFGMTPEQVIAVEKANGFYYDLTSKGEMLYNTGSEYNLYYGTNVGKLGTINIMRFEYDFDLKNKQMYQFYYVFKGQNAFAYLSPALTNKYGPADSACKYATDKYLEIGADSHISHNRWAVPNGRETVVIDLWYNEYDVCFLSYQSFNVQRLMEEEEALNFGL